MDNTRPADIFDAQCPSRDLLDLVASKWAMLVICTLKNGPVRTGCLRRAVSGISQKMLTHTLRELERNGIIERIDHRECPPRVEYRLTEMGRSLSHLMKDMELWIVSHYDGIIKAQQSYRRSEKSRLVA
ncbi:transcriptional regulator [Rhizobium leguminosarum]|uniref:winged helix-turn-helix transcriptional regulator n=1 Tax=Rhizobium TaxID=379 RepID=UPI0010325EB2|nr:helix-turn-helix domain-containing protein [Rhizobium leguminosarum]TBF87500.1 transcriptional regulator [Rhizobium leguminosarum]TBG06976.1 transcriptional regulator [Rhizobium leguminosarum]TBG07847.1 transcriptional regulator [Rhizobium leguminosarum]TBG30013.1 transcriptional regulator [Rhizobium leguminosarum]TBG50146.1 transcriptional regulator [Rhizobium leguminosarum]